MVTLKEILEIPSFSGMEVLVVEYITKFCIEHNFQYKIDEHNNVYVTKGKINKGEYYPCVVAHTDTVHSDQRHLILGDKKIHIVENVVDGKIRFSGFDNVRNRPTGIGGDDKAGVYICLKLLLDFDVMKAAFFVKEEIGMKGSQYADKKFFKNVGYAIQFDGPTRNWFSKSLMGQDLWNESFMTDIKPLLENYKVDNFSKDPYTDVYQLVKKFDFCGAVFPTGYYDWHSPEEYVIPEETEECYELGKESLYKLGNKKYTFKREKQEWI